MKHVLWICIFILMGCAADDAHPPTVTLAKNSITLTQAHIDWRTAERHSQSIIELMQLAATLPLTTVTASSHDVIELTERAVTLHYLSMSFWKDGRETFMLFNVDDPHFSYPEEIGDYVVELRIETDLGSAQYVTPLTIIAP